MDSETLSSRSSYPTREFLTSGAAIVAGLAFVKFALHIFAGNAYGYFRDELYYLACGDHLDWGYVDQPPLIAAIARLTRALLGDSLRAIRLPAVFAGAVQVALAGWMARELGGSRWAQCLAATALLIAPIYLVMDGFLSMNAFEPLFWMLCAFTLMRIIRTGNQRLWLGFGLLAGVALLNKHTTLFFGLGIFSGLLLTPLRGWLRQKWVWLGALVAFLIFLPNVVWEMRHGWPTLELLRSVARYKNEPVSVLGFVYQQILLMHPLTFPIWAAGLYFFLRGEKERAFRVFGWAYVVMLVALVALKGRVYYLTPAYPMLLAAGAVAVEGYVRERNWDRMKPAMIAVLLLGGVIAAPLAVPILPVEALAEYSVFWHANAIKVERHELGKLPQFFADMFGWENQVATVARVYRSLSPEEQTRAVILTENYGQAGAVDLFGPAYGLPKAISGHNNYYLWGPRGYSGEVVIAVGLSAENLQRLFAHVELAATIRSAYAMPDENNLPVYLCRKPRLPLAKAWPKLKHYE